MTGRRHPVWLGVAVAAAALAYSVTSDGALLFDDRNTVAFVRESPFAERFGALANALTGGRLFADGTSAWGRRSGGGDLRSYHVVNIILHLGAVLLVFAPRRRVLRDSRWTGTDGLAVFVAAFFALHPVQSQAVNYVSQ